MDDNNKIGQFVLKSIINAPRAITGKPEGEEVSDNYFDVKDFVITHMGELFYYAGNIGLAFAFTPNKSESIDSIVGPEKGHIARLAKEGEIVWVLGHDCLTPYSYQKEWVRGTSITLQKAKGQNCHGEVLSIQRNLEDQLCILTEYQFVCLNDKFHKVYESHASNYSKYATYRASAQTPDGFILFAGAGQRGKNGALRSDTRQEHFHAILQSFTTRPEMIISPSGKWAAAIGQCKCEGCGIERPYYSLWLHGVSREVCHQEKSVTKPFKNYFNYSPFAMAFTHNEKYLIAGHLAALKIFDIDEVGTMRCAGSLDMKKLGFFEKEKITAIRINKDDTELWFSTDKGRFFKFALLPSKVS